MSRHLTTARKLATYVRDSKRPAIDILTFVDVAEHPGTSAADVAERLGYKRGRASTIDRSLKRWRDSGHIEAKLVQSGQTKIELRLTPAGKGLIGPEQKSAK